jgi:hypothetical protein
MLNTYVLGQKKGNTPLLPTFEITCVKNTHKNNLSAGPLLLNTAMGESNHCCGILPIVEKKLPLSTTKKRHPLLQHATMESTIVAYHCCM